MAWQALLDGAEAERAREIVEQIADRLEAAPATHAGLVDAAGRALLFAYLDREAATDAQLERAAARTDLPGPALFNGLAGLAFVMTHVGAEVDEDIDLALAERLGPNDRHDLIFGVSGIGIYALEGLPRTRPLLTAVIEWIHAHATRAAHGRYLFTHGEHLGPDLQARFPTGAIDLGVAHGQAGAITVAAQAAAVGVARARELYDDLTSYLWSQAADGDGAAFGPVSGANPGRMAWCYGDPGVATAIYTAGAAVGDDETCRRAIAIARSVARRMLPASVDEAHLCHGATGIAHGFNRLAQAAEDGQLHNAARAWFTRALSLPLPARLDLLEGQLGVALALAATLTSRAPRWDRALGLSFEVQGGAPLPLLQAANE